MTRPRYLFMAMPPPTVLNDMRWVIEQHRLDNRLGCALFQPSNWHQSLSGRYWEGGPGLLAQLLRAGSRVSAVTVPLTLNRIFGSRTHWAFKAKGRPAGFADLLAAIRTALAAEGLPNLSGHTPHVTISYSAPEPLATLKIEQPILWIVNEIVLVNGGGSPYHYEIIGRWPLLPSRQLNLF